MRRKPQLNIRNKSFAELEEIISRDRSSPKPQFNQSFLNIVDDEGNNRSIEDIGTAYVALAYLGEVDEIRQIERDSQIPARGIEHVASNIAAAEGYKIILEKSVVALAQSVDPLVQLDLLIRDFKTIEEVTAAKPIQDIDDAVYSIMANWKSETDIMNGIRAYFRNSNNKPSNNVAQQLYEAVYSTEIRQTLRNVKSLYQLFGIQPKLDGYDVPIETFAREIRKRGMVQTKLSNIGSNPLSYDDILTLAKFDQETFVELMERRADKIQYPETVNSTEVAAMLVFYKESIKNKIPLSEKVKETGPQHLIISSAYLMGGSTTPIREGVREVFNGLIESGLYSPDHAVLASTFDQAFAFLYDDFLRPKLESRDKGYVTGMIGSARVRSSFMEELSESIGTPISDTSRGYINNIQQARPK